MILGIFGGTFDPPHVAHVMACVYALGTGEIDRVLMIPTAHHAFGKQPGASFTQRLVMCRIAAQLLPADAVEVSDIEGRREGTSYMIDTVRALLVERPDARFRLIVGTDILPDLPKWRDNAELLRLAPILEVPRIVVETPGDPRGPRPGALPLLSSTDVRARLASSVSATGLVPAAVIDYIRANGLYLPGSAGAPTGQPASSAQ